MAINEELLSEYKGEAAKTRKMLERVPTEKLAWKPHEKSMTLGRLATHLAELPIWLTRAIETSELDFDKNPYTPVVCETTEAILQLFDERVEKGLDSLQTLSEGNMDDLWSMRRGGKVVIQMPRKAVLKNLAFNHVYHHRGQLSVYLRLLDIPVPGMYGPSADER